MKYIICTLAALLQVSPAALEAAEGSSQGGKPAAPGLMTRWGTTVTQEKVLPEYPRPQMVRKEWQNLNGLWQFAVGKPDEAVPVGKMLPRQILVPFPMESALSGIRETAEFVWYRRTFEVPAAWRGKRILLHFGAVDWEATVYLNGHQVGSHRGGYDPFTLDITDAVTPAGPQELIVAVADPMKGQAAGKQSRERFFKPRGSIFYECVTGIWQTVWLEPVPVASIQELRLTPDVDAKVLRLKAVGRGASGYETVEAVALSQGREVARVTGKLGDEINLPVGKPRLWSPDSPYLYELKVTLKNGSRSVDVVESYFAMRKVALGKDERGITRILLNDKFTFMMGSLDQGFWPDGIYTAPTDEALRFDIEFAKRLGLNLARKHVKVEPERWYYWCDKLGLLVWQDMPAFSRNTKGYDEEMARIIESRKNHPCIALWIMQNETYSTREMLEKATAVARKSDPSRLVIGVSGCPDWGLGDIKDRHHYPGPSSYTPTDDQAVVLGEWGYTPGNVPGHDWFEIVLNKSYPPWPTSSEKLDLRHEQLVRGMWQLVHTPGLSGAAWTQLTDIEGECNGFITYDREVVKNNLHRINLANRGYVAPAALPDVRFDPKSEDPLHGLFVDTQKVSLYAPRPDAIVRYTLDGSEPGPHAPRYSAPIVLADTTTIKARAYWPDQPPSGTVEFLYRKITDFQPSVIVGKIERGVACQYFSGQQVVHSGTIENISFQPGPPYKRKPGDRFVWKAVLRIPQDGLYTFTSPAAEMKFVIDGNIVFPGSGGRNIHVGDWESLGQIALQAGHHQIEAEWIVSPATQYFVTDCPIQVAAPGVAKQRIPSAWLSHEIGLGVTQSAAGGGGSLASADPESRRLPRVNHTLPAAAK